VVNVTDTAALVDVLLLGVSLAVAAIPEGLVTTRYRLNRGGNRKLNHALHRIAIDRCRLDPETKAYVARRLTEGKTKLVVLQCLKRHLASVVFRQLMADTTIEIAA
jgi:transposase